MIYCQHENCNYEAIECTLPMSDEPDYYCSAHAQEHGFCIGCGHFMAGTTEFDIIHPGWCSDCYNEYVVESEDPDDIDFDFNYDEMI